MPSAMNGTQKDVNRYPGWNGERVLVINRGVGGNNTKDALARIERDVLPLKPDCLILDFGMNDSLNSVKLIQPLQFEVNLKHLVELARGGGIKTIVLVSLNPVVETYVRERHKSYPFTDNLNSRIDKYNRMIKKVAGDSGAILADFHSAVIGCNVNLDSKDSVIRNTANSKSRDGIHLTATGCKLLAKTVSDSLEGRINPGDRIVCFGDSITYGANIQGAGTAIGDSYPAWLSIILNLKLGLSDSVPPAKL